MPSIIRRMFSKRPKDYLEQKSSLQSAKVKERLALAKDKTTHKEILYYLAENDPDPKVRKAVVHNKAMPMQASPVLAGDSDVDVRYALAGRLVDLLPNLSQDEQSQLYAYAVQALGTLALDEVLKIRVALSSTLKDHAQAPPKVAGQLARDVEREVSEPILRFCAALADEDLLDILKSHPAGWVIEAVARRDIVSEEVSEAVIGTDHVPGGTALIDNEGAQLSESLLELIVEKAREHPEWQKPVAVRQSLPSALAKELASFVEASVRDLLMARQDFDPETTEEVAAIFRRRMDFAVEFSPEEGREDDEASVEERLNRALEENNLTEAFLSDALAMRDYPLVYAALAHMVHADKNAIAEIFDMSSAKSIVSVAWYAGLSMRFALELQKTAGKVQPARLLYPKNGSDYPLTGDDMNWQLEFLGLKGA